MKNYSFITVKSLEDFISKFSLVRLENSGSKAVCIFDVDGVFFDNILDYHTWFFSIKDSKKKL